MSNKSYSKLYRNLTRKILDKIVTPQVLGNTAALEQNLAQQSDKVRVCYVLQDASLSNTVLIDKEAEKRGLPSVFSEINIEQSHESDSILVLNDTDPVSNAYHYPEKLIRLIEYLDKYPEYEIELIPVTVLWGRAPEYEDSWFKALFSDAWSTPSKLKQTINISLYGRENYIEFHKPLSLRALVQDAKTHLPNFSPAHPVVQELNSSFNKYKEAILGPDLSDRRNLINSLLKTEAVRQAIVKESIEEKVSMLEAENRARSYLMEIVSDFSYSTLRFAEIALTKLWTQLYDGIEVHNFDTVRELAQDYEVVYTPCHRSHIDYLLLSYVIFKRGLMVPHIAAGINLNMPVVGQLMRGAGAYFIRRTFSGNELYTSVFKEYLHSLLSRNTPLEYFIEGGRSRTGLLLPPKKGMLSMTVQSHLRGSTKPVVFIPAYFGYEKLLEGSSYLNELSGKPKEAESLFGLLSSMRKIEKVFGQVYVNFGEPVFLKDVLEENAADQLKLRVTDDLPKPVIQTVNQVSSEILENINKAVVINPVSLISLILLNTEKNEMSESLLVQHLLKYKTLLKQLCYDKRMIMTELAAAEIIEYVLKLKQIERYNHQGETWIRVVTNQKVLLSYFSNNILHCFILTSVISSIISIHKKIQYEELTQYIEKIYPFIKEEMFLKWSQAELNTQIQASLNSLTDIGLIQVQNDQLIPASDTESAFILHSVAEISTLTMNNFTVMIDLLGKYAVDAGINIKSLEKMCKSMLKKLNVSGQIHSGFYFDSSTLKSFIHIMKERKLITVQDNMVQINSEQLDTAYHIFSWYNAETRQIISEASNFTEKELKDFSDLTKK